MPGGLHQNLEQLQPLLEVSRLRNVVLQVLPFEQAFSDASRGPMVLVEGRDSKAAPSGPELRIATPAWAAVVSAVRPEA
ncbi:Scr1 family TA system antitoxin-like transcriptional regulator [Streptomyces albogriseolus]|uniref:DUF5753 domain-containing protein n=2 Tax=Streptomyces albogriseolus group TaxID=2867120 RepID=A0ABP6U7L3_9ACTN|nr:MULTISPECIES: Scr1 family TA system antitoxin-like transcriptional regulator [Streptomyces]MCX4621418.1 DUF5753 domain-containing protein [Streptomyces viridodiastaticus]